MRPPNTRAKCETHTKKNVLWIASIDVWHGIFHYFPCFKQIASSYHRQIVAGNRENRKIDIFTLLESEKRDETRDTKQEEWMKKATVLVVLIEAHLRYSNELWFLYSGFYISGLSYETVGTAMKNRCPFRFALKRRQW